MYNTEKQNTWLVAANKIVAIFLIVAAVHVAMILFLVWFNVWRLKPGEGQVKKNVSIQEKVFPGNENRKIPNIGTAGKYTVVAGDYLSKIARKAGTSVEDLRSLNHLENDNIKIGQILLIPGKPKDPSTSLTDSEVLSELKQK